jgi:hypothetical protein
MISLFLYLFSSLFCVTIANLIKPDTKIVDIIHNNFQIINYPYISDFLILIQTIYVLTIMDSESLSKTFFIMFIVQICKGLCSISTVLPQLKRYEDKYRLGGINGSGTEYIFSGHACYSCLSAFYLYFEKNFNGLFLIFYNLISQFLIILTRNHYTVDVILAWIITSLVYFNIELCIKTECNNYIAFIF